MNWNDNGNSANLRPKFVDLEIYKNNLLFKEIEIPATNYYVIEDLEKYDENGNEIVYSYKLRVNNRYLTEQTNNTFNISLLSSTFSVIIPKTLILDAKTGKAEYSVIVKGELIENDTLNVIPDKSFSMKDENNRSFLVNVEQEQTMFTNTNMNKTIGYLKSEKTIPTGKWYGIFNFEIFLEAQ